MENVNFPVEKHDNYYTNFRVIIATGYAPIHSGAPSPPPGPPPPREFRIEANVGKVVTKKWERGLHLVHPSHPARYITMDDGAVRNAMTAKAFSPRKFAGITDLPPSNGTLFYARDVNSLDRLVRVYIFFFYVIYDVESVEWSLLFFFFL